MPLKPQLIHGVLYTPQNIKSLCQPIEAVAEELANQNQYYYAQAMRDVVELLIFLSNNTICSPAPNSSGPSSQP